MIARTTRRPRRPRPRARFERACAPLRRQWQGRYTRDSREARYAQVDGLRTEDVPPSVLRGRHYRYVPLPPTPRPRWERQLAHALVLAVVALILYGAR